MKLEDIKKIIKEQLTSDSVLLAKPPLVTEANYNRVRSRIEEELIPFVMITAFRGGFSQRDNLVRQKELESRVRDAGFSWTKMPGSGYVEDPEEAGGTPNEVKENSIIIWDAPRADVERANEDLFQLGQTLATEYNQDSFIFGGPRSDKPDNPYTIHLYTNDGTIIDEVWAGGEEGYERLFFVDDAAEYWSKIAGKKTQFKEIYDKWKNFKSKSRLDAMKKQYYLNLIEAKIKND
jgi:hypothetical protein